MLNVAPSQDWTETLNFNLEAQTALKLLTYFASRARAKTPAASGAAADVPE